MLCNPIAARQTPARAEWDDRSVPGAKRKKTKRDDALAPYRKIRKPTPPPEKVIGNRRRQLDDEATRREIAEATERRGGRRDDEPRYDG
jgi:hypothetical protein